MIPINPRATVEWTWSREMHSRSACPCGADPCEAEPGTPIPGAAVFLLGPPSERQRADIVNAAASLGRPDPSGSRPISILTGSVRLLRLRYGLRGVVRGFPGWSTMPDPLGGPRPIPTPEFIETIPDSVAVEMDAAISALTDVSEETVGKSEAPSAQPGPTGSATPAGGAHA